jgi:CRISPR-associated protein Cas6/Cse3/CasE subtype I-E
MYMTRLPLIKGDDYRLHQHVREIFPGEQRVLFQTTDDSIIVISQNQAVKGDVTSTRVDPASFADGKRHTFTLRLNPVKRDKKTRKRVPQDESQIKKWIAERLLDIGVEARFQYVFENIHQSKRREEKISFFSVLCFGSLVVKDGQTFAYALANGIGHGKGFGFGLLNVFF